MTSPPMTPSTPPQDAAPPIAVHMVQIAICQPCLDGVGEMCTTPGCALWLHKVDLPIHREVYEIIETWKEPS